MPPLPKDVFETTERTEGTERTVAPNCDHGKPCGMTCIRKDATCHTPTPPPPPQPCASALEKQKELLRQMLAACPDDDLETTRLRQVLGVSDCTCQCRQCDKNTEAIKLMLPVCAAMEKFLDSQGGGGGSSGSGSGGATIEQPQQQQEALPSPEDEAGVEQELACDDRIAKLQADLDRMTAAYNDAVQNAPLEVKVPEETLAAPAATETTAAPAAAAAAAAPESSTPIPLETLLAAPSATTSTSSSATVEEVVEDDVPIPEQAGKEIAAVSALAIEAEPVVTGKVDKELRNPNITARNRLNAAMKANLQSIENWYKADNDFVNSGASTLTGWISNKSAKGVTPNTIVRRCIAFLSMPYANKETQMKPISPETADALKSILAETDVDKARKMALKAVETHLQKTYGDWVGPETKDDKLRAANLRLISHYFGSDSMGEFDKTKTVIDEYMRIRDCALNEGTDCDDTTAKNTQSPGRKAKTSG